MNGNRLVWEYIVAFAKERGYMPSLNDIAEGVGRSKSTVYDHIQRLEREGLLETVRVPGRNTITRIKGAQMVVPEVTL